MVTKKDLQKKVEKQEATKKATLEKRAAKEKELNDKFNQMKAKFDADKKAKLKVFDDEVAKINGEIKKFTLAIAKLDKQDEELKKLLETK